MNDETLWYVKSKITNSIPGMTKGKVYRVYDRGFYQGAWISFDNDRGDRLNLYEYDKFVKVCSENGKPIKTKTKRKVKKHARRKTKKTL